MKLWPTALLILCSQLHAAPPPDSTALTDDALLRLIKERGTGMKLITPEPVRMPSWIALACGEPAPAEIEYEKQNPHLEKYARVLVTPAGEAAATGHEPFHPAGTVILKEKLTTAAITAGDLQAGTTTELFTGMLKREKGYNPAVGDWEFFTVSGDAGKITSRGKLESCTKCHSGYPDQDFVSREYLRPKVLEPDAGGTVVLPAADAQVYGQMMRYEPQPHKNTLGYWTRVEDHAEWQFKTVPGTYEVEVLQGCGKGSGGAEATVAAGTDELSFTVEDTGHFQNFKARVIGKLRIGEGTQTLRVVPKTKPGAAVMDLRQVTLRKVAD